MKPSRTVRPGAFTGKMSPEVPEIMNRMDNHKEPGRMSGRELKKWMRALLESDADWPDIFGKIDEIRPRRTVNPLFACFYDKSSLIKWRAVAAMGHTVARLAETEMESARVVMRRLIWNLNDESGGIGWGSPEAMGEIMAQSRPIANEYAPLLASYIQPNKNFLEHEGLQRGAIWAVGRLADRRPEMMAGAEVFLEPFLDSTDPFHRGYATWALGNLKSARALPAIEALQSDPAEIEIFLDMQLITTTVGRLAENAAAAIANGER